MYPLLSSYLVIFVFLASEISPEWAHQMCQKELPQAKRPLEYRSLHLYNYFFFDSKVFLASFSVLWLIYYPSDFFTILPTSQYFSPSATFGKINLFNHFLKFISNFCTVCSILFFIEYQVVKDWLWRGNWLKSQNGTLFSHVWRRGRLALDPLQK